MTYDKKCYDLAKLFLSDREKHDTAANCSLLAGRIQQTIEDFLAEIPMCEGCDDFPALPNSKFCAECQKDIKADSRHEDPARSHGRPQ